MKSIKIVKVPGATTEITTDNDNATLGEMLDIYTEQGNTVDGYEARIGDSTAAVTFVPADGSKVYLVQKVKGRF